MTSRNRYASLAAMLLIAATSSSAFAQTVETAAPASATMPVDHADDEAQSPPSERYEAVGDGTVRDKETGLIWADKDNGGDIDWDAARRYCAAKGEGWNLPKADDLVRIYDAQRQLHQECIGQLHCSITPLISLSGLTPWTREANGASEAWYVYLADGKPYAYAVTSTQGKRALCVKGS